MNRNEWWYRARNLLLILLWGALGFVREHLQLNIIYGGRKTCKLSNVPEQSLKQHHFQNNFYLESFV